MKKDLLSLKDLSSQEIEDIFNLTSQLKKDKAKYSRALSGKTLALIFQKPSNRTRVSFEVAMYQLGGYTIYLAPHEISLGVRESIKDVAKTLSRYVDAIVLRTFEHNNCLEMAQTASIPVINGLSDFEHPCQAMADLFTIKEKFKKFKGLTLAYVGDGNNVCHSLLFACAKVGMNMQVGSPKGFAPDKVLFEDCQAIAKKKGTAIRLYHDATSAVKGADIVYTDVWASMGQEKEALKRRKVFKGFQVNKQLLNSAKRNAYVMHCLPAHRGEEITDEVLDNSHSIVFEQAENRMHVQKAILIKLLRS
jgi:ornithine carbamoyltransferase